MSNIINYAMGCLVPRSDPKPILDALLFLSKNFLLDRFRQCRRNQRCATKVGTPAVAMTTATSTENCAEVMWPAWRPKRAEMVPKVKPVLIRSVG